MASVEFIQKRIAGKQAEIAKLEKKLARIIKAQESGWEVNPYYYGESDLKYTNRDLEAARTALAKYEADLQTEQEKDASRNVKVILDFLDAWAKNVYNWYTAQFEKYVEARKEYGKRDTEYCNWYNNGGWRDPNRVQIEKAHKEYRKTFAAQWRFMEPYAKRVHGGWVFDADRLNRELEQEKKAKYDDIINRTNAICGTITDASGLYCGDKGDLNGIIIGERGQVRVQTIGAGGWNIQCFHFRTLVHEVR